MWIALEFEGLGERNKSWMVVQPRQSWSIAHSPQLVEDVVRDNQALPEQGVHHLVRNFKSLPIKL
jgi:hypothetical protein